MLSTGLPLLTSPPFQPMKPEAKESPETLEPMPAGVHLICLLVVRKKMNDQLKEESRLVA